MVIVLILLFACIMLLCKMRKQNTARTSKIDLGPTNPASDRSDDSQAEVDIELQQRPLPSSPKAYDVPRAKGKGDETEPSDSTQYVATEHVTSQDNMYEVLALDGTNGYSELANA